MVVNDNDVTPEGQEGPSAERLDAIKRLAQADHARYHDRNSLYIAYLAEAMEVLVAESEGSK